MTYASFWQWYQELTLPKSHKQTQTEVHYEHHYCQIPL
jgi:hypothetical protein